MPIGVAGAVSLGAAAIGAGASLYGSSQSAGAAKSAAGQQQAQYQQTRADLAPYRDNGAAANNLLSNNLPEYATADQDYVNQANSQNLWAQHYYDTAQSQYDAAAKIGQGPGGQAALEATPGYQFSLQQGLQATQNSAAARGLGVSGAALKGAATYATGLADNTYQQQYNDAVQNARNTQSTAAGYTNLSGTSLNENSSFQGNLTNSYNKLMGIANLGENAAAQTGNTGATLANQAGQATMAAGNASAAGAVGVGNAASSGANNYLQSSYLQQLQSNKVDSTTNVDY